MKYRTNYSYSKMEIRGRSAILIFNLIVIVKFVKCANILGLMPVASPSHNIWNNAIMYALAEQGHNVTILCPDIPKPSEKIPKNVHFIHLEEVYNTMYKSSGKIDIRDMVGIAPHNEIPIIYKFVHQNNKGVLNSKGFQQLMNYPDDFKFDVILIEYTADSVVLGFIHRFHYPPVIGITPYLLPPNTIDYIGGHSYPAYIPFSLYNCDSNMNFWQRLYNTYLYAADTLYRLVYFAPKIDTLLRQYFSKDIPHITDLRERTLIAFTNSHPSIHFSQPLPPNVIEIAGAQVLDPKPLEKDIEDFIDKSKKGAIYFSLGTNMKPTDVTPEEMNIILETMKAFPDYNFLWKFDKNYVKRKIPSNVMIKTFYPQRDILAHPKLKLFVTHAGGLSTQESTWRGVPMVGLPLFVDQHRNIFKLVLAGAAVKVDYRTMTVDILKGAINEVLTNKSYNENVKKLSQRFRDRPMKPLDTAVWWVEYILRHPNPTHLKSPVLAQGFFIANSYDILAFVLIVLVCFSLICYKLYKFLLSQLKSEKQTIESNKKNN